MNSIQTAAKLYECRDVAKSLLGAQYLNAIEPWKKAVRDEMEARKCSEINAAIAINKRADGMAGDGVAMMMVFAAVVEIAEPSSNFELIPRGDSHGP